MALWLIHSVLNVFAGGRSMIKTFLILGAFGAAALIAAFAWRGRLGGSFERWERASKASLAACLAVAFAAGLACTLYLYRSVDAGWGETLLATSQSSYSSTRLIHSHVMKAGFASIARAVPGIAAAFEGRADIGLGYTEVLPRAWGWIVAALLIATVVSGTATAALFVARNKGRYGLIALFIVVLVSAIKNAFDGGILNHEAVPAVTALLVILGAARLRMGWVAAALHAFVIAVVATLHFSGSLSGSDLAQYCLYLVGLDLVYLSWLFLCRTGSSRWRGVVGLAAGAACLAPISVADLSGYGYSRWPVREGSYMLTYGLGEGVVADRIGGATVYRIDGPAGRTAADFASAAGDTTMYTPIISCSAPDVFRQFVSKVATRDSLAPIASSSLARVAFESWGDAGRWKVYDVEASFSSCLPRAMNALSELVRSAGGRDAIIILPYAYSNQYPRWKIFQPR